MTEDQFAVCLRAFSRRKPFRHFIIEFLSGEHIRIKHPEGAGPFAGVWLFIDADGSRVVFASTSVCRLLDVPGAER